MKFNRRNFIGAAGAGVIGSLLLKFVPPGVAKAIAPKNGGDFKIKIHPRAIVRKGKEA